ncbi:MAG: hypothetical protein Ta2A_26760 [Treponemataceae bacterium]|nr:MAG: hypothetical protein Ta2A_26760 [Treponemataceae bacterium]
MRIARLLLARDAEDRKRCTECTYNDGKNRVFHDSLRRYYPYQVLRVYSQINRRFTHRLTTPVAGTVSHKVREKVKGRVRAPLAGSGVRVVAARRVLHACCGCAATGTQKRYQHA